MKKIIFILALFVSFVANAQYTPPAGYTNINSRYDWLAGVFRALHAPAGTTPALTSGQYTGAGALFFRTTDSTLKVWTGTQFIDAVRSLGEVTQSALDDTAAAIRGDFPVYTASEGLYKSGNDIRLGGPIASPSLLTEHRAINLGAGRLTFGRNSTPVLGQGGYTPLYGEFIDTVYASSLPSSVIPTAATSWNRIFRVTGNFASQFKVGHAQTLKYEFGANAPVLSNGGDFGGSVYNTLSFGYIPSFTTGHLTITGGVTAFESVFSALSNTEFSASSASRHMRYTGWLAGHNVNLRMTNFTDTIDNYIFYNAASFKEANAKVINSYGYYFNGVPSVNKAWSLFSPISANKMFHEGSVIIGGADTSTVSPYKFKVNGDSYFSDSVYLNTAREVTDTIGMDIVLRKQSDGSLLRIKPYLLGVGGGSQTLQQVFDQEVGGSVLTKDDTISSNYELKIIGNSAVAFGNLFSVTNSSTTGRAINAASAGTNSTIQAINTKTTAGGGGALWAVASGSNAVASFNRDSSSTATVIKVVDLTRTTSGTAADGIGSALHFNVENQSGSTFFTNSVEAIWKNSIEANKESMLRIRGVDNTFEEVFMDIQKDLVIINNGADTLATKAYARSVGGGGGGGDALTSNPLSQFAATTSAQFAGVITDETGTGAVVLGTSPDFTTGVTIGSVAVPTISSTNTLTNKRITARYSSETSSATPTINTDNVDVHEITALAVNITSMTTNLTGTPAIDDVLHIAITGTATRTIAWGASFQSSTVALPTTTNGTNRLDIVLVWTGSIWRCASVW